MQICFPVINDQSLNELKVAQMLIHGWIQHLTMNVQAKCGWEAVGWRDCDLGKKEHSRVAKWH